MIVNSVYPDLIALGLQYLLRPVCSNIQSMEQGHLSSHLAEYMTACEITIHRAQLVHLSVPSVKSATHISFCALYIEGKIGTNLQERVRNKSVIWPCITHLITRRFESVGISV